MRKILLLSAALALFLLAVMYVQRALVLALTNRPFLGIWAQDAMFYPGGPPTRIEFQRGGNLGISRFGEAPRRARWEEGTRGREIIVTGFDPAQPTAREAYGWNVSRNQLMLFPMLPPSTGVQVFRPGAGSIFGYGYTRASSLAWPAPQSFVGRWASPLGHPVPRLRNGRFPFTRRRVLLDLKSQGKLWLYEEGQPPHQGTWTADESSRRFILLDEQQGPSSGRDTWDGRLTQGPGRETLIDFAFRHRPRMGTGLEYLGRYQHLSEAPPDQRPFLGAWRTLSRYKGHHLQLALLPGGKLRVTADDGSPRCGTWREVGPWPRVTLTGLDPKEPKRETEWYWSLRNADRSLVYGVNGREHYVMRLEVLELLDAGASSTTAQEDVALAMERVPSPSSDRETRSNLTRP